GRAWRKAPPRRRRRRRRCRPRRLPSSGLGDDVDPRVRELLARVHELEGQKSVLSRQLSERPIVYQFGPDENDPDINDEYDVEAHAPDGASRGLAALSIATICCVVLAVCWRCIMRSLVVCRRQKPTQLVEKSLRHFTRSLLKRPLLLWLFYLHVMVLWAMEGWRQAALNSAAHQSSRRRRSTGPSRPPRGRRRRDAEAAPGGRGRPRTAARGFGLPRRQIGLPEAQKGQQSIKQLRCLLMGSLAAILISGYP
ncbi:unnamed protein product, partial [Prorocentrum cordatum]